MAKLDKPASHEYKSVNSFIADTKPLVQRETDFIGLRDDLVTLRKEREHGHLDAVIEMFINRAKNTGWTIATPGAANTTTDKMQKWLRANARAGRAASWINFIFLSFLVPGLFVIPIYILSLDHVQHDIGQSIGERYSPSRDTPIRSFGRLPLLPAPVMYSRDVMKCANFFLGVLIAFAATFLFILWVGTPAKTHEVWSCAAAYVVPDQRCLMILLTRPLQVPRSLSRLPWNFSCKRPRERSMTLLR